MPANLWKVGFDLTGLSLVQLLSGLVKIKEVYWNSEQNALIFVVDSQDKTDTLFKRGVLAGEPIKRYRTPRQGLLVESVRLDKADQVQD